MTGHVDVVVGRVEVGGQPIDLRVVSDEHPAMEAVYRLWYEVYADELKYPVADPEQRAARAMRSPPNGSLVLLASAGERCVGTMRMSYAPRSADEFELAYAHLLPGRMCGVASKFVVSKPLRKTSLPLHLWVTCFEYSVRSGDHALYDTILVSCQPWMLHYYESFGFEKLSPRPVPHPVLGDDSYILHCSKALSGRNVAELRRVLAGDRLLALRWAARTGWGRLKARVRRRLGANTSTQRL